MSDNAVDYSFTTGSDIDRDGMYLETRDARGHCVAEVFYSDVTGKMIVTLNKPSLPAEVVVRLLARAKVRLSVEMDPRALTLTRTDPVLPR